MHFDDLLHKYFDGEASPEEKRTLLDAVKKDSELKKEFKLMKRMERNYPKIIPGYTPDINVSKEIFQNIGLEYRGHRRFFVTGFLFGGLPIIFALLLTVIFFSDLNFSAKSSKPHTKEEKISGSLSQTGFNNEETTSVKPISILTSKETGSNIKTSTPAKPAADNPTFVEENNQVDNTNDIASVEQSKSYRSRTNIPQSDKLNPEFGLLNAPNYDMYWQSGGNGKISVEARYSNAWLLPSPTIDPQSNVLNNFSIAAYYQALDELKLGLEYRQEQYFLDYSRFDSNLEYYYEQQPSIASIGLSARYNPEALKFWIFSPFAQTGVGVNQYSFILRGGAGLETRITNSFGVTFFGDFNRVFYNYDNSWHGSNRFSLHYGLFYKF